MEETTEAVESPQTDLNISDVSTDDLRNALGTTEVEDSNVQDSEITETEEQIATEPTGEVSEEPEETEIQELDSEESEEERLAKRRVRPRNQRDQQVIDLYRSSGFEGSFADASSIIYGTNLQNTQPEPVAQQEVVDNSPTYEDNIQAIKNEVTELESKINEANEELDTALALKLQRDVFRKELEINKLEGQQQRDLENQQYQAEETQRQKALESRGRAVEMYPELDNKESVYRKEFDHFLSESEQNPDYAVIFSSPRWCEIMANEFAVIKGVSPNAQQQVQPQVQPQPQAQPQPQVQPQMGNQAKVLTTGQTTQPVNAPATADGLISQLPNMDKKDIYSLLGSSGGAQPLR